MGIGWIRAALGAALLIAGAGLGIVGAMAARDAGEGAGAPRAPGLAEAIPAPERELLALGEALERHLPPDALVLGWPDVTNRLGLPEESARFDWMNALLAPRDEGIRRLRERAGDRSVHLVVHVRDALLLAAAAPGRLGVAVQDKADSGNLHGMINSARDWVRAENLVAYTAYRLDDSRLRLVALTDDASLDTLAGRLLPFHDPRRRMEPVPGLTLVHQVGGFWVYRLEPGQG